MTEQLSEKSDDNVLREQIIKLAGEMKPLPVIPEEARRAFVHGRTIAKDAKDVAGQQLAVNAFRDAIKAAPWWGDAYYNLAIEQELVGLFTDARESLGWYIKTKPDEKEARSAQDKIYEIEAREKLAKETETKESGRIAAAQAAEQAKRDEEAKRKKLADSLIWLKGIWNSRWCRGAAGTSCTDAEYKGRNWITTVEPVGQTGVATVRTTFELQADGTVSLPACREGNVIGRPFGSGYQDITWELRPSNGGPARSLWVSIASDQKSIVVGCERPSSTTQFDPSRSYHYLWYFRP